MSNKLTGGLLAAACSLLLIGAGCATSAPDASEVRETGTTEQPGQDAAETEIESTTVSILHADGKITLYSPEEDAWLDNGCLTYDGSCYVRNPDGSGTYVPEGVDFYGDEADAEAADEEFAKAIAESEPCTKQ